MRSKAFAMLAIALALEAGLLSAAQAQAAAELKSRCSQLIAYYDRYGMGRSTDSDGRRNHTRIGARSIARMVSTPKVSRPWKIFCGARSSRRRLRGRTCRKTTIDH